MGSGAQAKVFRVTRASDGQEFALKYMTPKNKDEREAYLNEFRFFSAFEGEQILRCIEVYYWQGKIFAFLELMEGGALTQIITAQRGAYSEAFCKYTLYMVAMGLKEIHSKNVLHRDIKSDNILCSPDGQIKIADLGFSACLT